MQPLPTLRYGGDDRQRILCALPKAPRGVVVFVHGGGWTEGAPEELASLAHWLASVGWAVACPGYRLAPGSPWPAALDDVLAALSLLRRELPTGPWLLGGHSAGAQLALMAALTGDVGALAGLFGLSGVYHLRLAARTTWMRQRWIVPAFGDDGPAWDAASPLEQVRGGLPPTWLASAAVDWGLGRQTDLLAERLRAEGVPVRRVVAFERHHRSIVARLAEPGDEVGRRLAGFYDWASASRSPRRGRWWRRPLRR